MAEVRQP